MRFHLLLILGLATLTACSGFRSQGTFSYQGKPTRAVASTDGLPEFELQWPLENAKLTRGFSPYYLNHYGIDLAKPRNTPILSAHSGRVIYVGHEFKGYGRLIIVEHPSGWATMYGHCQKIFAREGQWVEMGQKIAAVGSSGNARGVHLHFELRRDKKAVDPVLYLP